MKYRLLIFHHTIAPYRIDFFNDLSKAFDTRICLQYRNLISQRFDYDRISSQFRFKPIYLPILFTLKSRIVNSGYWKQLEEFKPDIVIVGEYGIDCLLVLLHRWLKRKRYKVVSICDDSYNMVIENNDFSRIHRLLRHKAVPLLDELILVEPKVAEWYQRNFGKGIFFPIIKQDEKARNTYRNLLPMSKRTAEEQGLSEKFVFLFVGRLVALKNVQTLLKAFIQLNRKEAVLVIVGDGPEKERLMRIAAESNADIRFTGRLESNGLWKWYNIASCLVLASYQESFGTVTNEALLAGCKCLISCKAGSACLIEDGKNGYTFDPMDVEDLTGKIVKILKEYYPPTYEAIRPSQMLLYYDEQHLRLVEHLKSL